MRSNNISSSPSKKGKSSDKQQPKQPQRGLGVAQLERIRMHNNYQLGCNPILPPNSAVHNPIFAPNLISQEEIRAPPQTHHVYLSPSPSPSPSDPSLYYSSSSTTHAYGIQGSHGVKMGSQDFGQANMRKVESQVPTDVPRWQYPGNTTGFGIQQYVEPTMTRSFIEPARVEGSSNNENKIDRNEYSMGLSSHDSESSSSQEIDLELRLSL